MQIQHSLSLIDLAVSHLHVALHLLVLEPKVISQQNLSHAILSRHLLHGSHQVTTDLGHECFLVGHNHFEDYF